ncbi:hypothetical protein ATANTOWER_004317 [Ataeniobius toweri]|uniref:Uncharacterized protein n=1 Tax=Ataeniobius toweri TaxID=208326 RepID=A0ABU7AM14_9TELE|nr:hypothetical protein [Ataeniobius toweri]
MKYFVVYNILKRDGLVTGIKIPIHQRSKELWVQNSKKFPSHRFLILKYYVFLFVNVSVALVAFIFLFFDGELTGKGWREVEDIQQRSMGRVRVGFLEPVTACVQD